MVRRSFRGIFCPLTVLVLLAGCGESTRPPPPCMFACGDAGPQCDTTYEPPPTPGDVDGDGIENDADEDADGDGVDNVFEHLGGYSCAGPDDDGDGIDNWLDTDSDNDGLLDGTEADGESDPYDPDTDDDTFSDLLEVAARTATGDPSSTLRDVDVVLIADLDGGAQTLTVRIPNKVENADVFFLVDTTGSMAEERMNLVESISELIVPQLVDAFDDVAFGAAGMDDYPVGEYGSELRGDLPFYLLTPMVDGLSDTQTSTSSGCGERVGRLIDGANDVPDIEDAIRGLACHNGVDLPESFVPALWATATGGGLDWTGGMVPPQTECGMDEVGYPCFRPNALPIVVLVGDAEFHNGPMDSEPYSFDAPTYEEARDALNAIGAKVVSVYSGPESTIGEYQLLARDTGAISPSGAELVFPISEDGSGIDNTVVEGIRTLASGTLQDITLGFSDDDEHPSDATALITSWTTGDSYTPDGVLISPPSSNETTFISVAPSAEVEFELVIENTTISPMEEAIVVVIKLSAIGTGGATFASRRVFVVIAEDASALAGLRTIP